MRRLLLIPLLAARCWAAVQNVDCREPRVFPGAAVNAVILPYEYVGSQGALERSEAAQPAPMLTAMPQRLPEYASGSIAE